MEQIDIQKIKESNIQSMKEAFKRDKKLFPVCIIVEPNGKVQYIGTPFKTHEEKDIMMNYVKDTCRKVKAIAVFIITEAWLKKIKKEDYEKVIEDMRKTGKRVADYGDKVEVAMMIFETKTSSENIIFDIDRQKNELVNMIVQPLQEGNFKNILCDIQTNTN